MTIPVYRHNVEYDDWEVASVYDSDDCDSLGRSEDDDASRPSYFDDPAPRSRSLYHDDECRRVEYPMTRYHHPPATLTHPRQDVRYLPGRESRFSPPPAPIIPPPGVIFPHKDWVHSPPQNLYWHSPTSQTRTISDSPANAGPDPVESSLLFAPSSPPHPSSALIRRPSPTRPIMQKQIPHATSVMVPGAGVAPNVGPYVSPVVPSPPRYHEVVRPISPRLAETEFQAHSGMTMSPPRRSGHDVSSPPGAAAGHVTTTTPPRGRLSSEEIAVADGRYGTSVAGRHASHPDPHVAPVPGKREEEYEYDVNGGRTRKARPQTRERRPSIWQRFVRRFSPSRASIGQT